MLLVTSESRYADLIERTFYNGFLSGISLQGEKFFYVNPLQSRSGDERHEWNPVACCPPNIMRLLSSLDQYLATTSDRGIQLHQYAPARIDVNGPDGSPISLRIETGYPWNGRIEVEVIEPGAGAWTLSLRVPDWATSASLDGAAVSPGGAADVTRHWQAGDRVVLELDLSTRLTTPNPRIDAIRGCVALERGPIVYCFEGADLPDGVDILDLALPSGSHASESGPVETLGGVPGLSIAGVVNQLDGWAKIEYQRLAGSAALDSSPVQLQAIPYFVWSNRGPNAMRVWLPVSG
jgi:hypothetical protein